MERNLKSLNHNVGFSRIRFDSEEFEQRLAHKAVQGLCGIRSSRRPGLQGLVLLDPQAILNTVSDRCFIGLREENSRAPSSPSLAS
ncbi:hypothetical protein Acr_11g0013180 [Actinidia rufa]|uniref:Uncharacterized protein n=1 Tax=Actinidia rufa TaxID=165716 RepID=A0A7J0FE82_9ERIC|nr:hypothetical protein Acr_11g0013180 [Actinidia rufa]